MKMLFATVLALSATLASAQSHLVPAQSELGFQSHQMGVPVDGSFKRFDAQLSFDPAKPAAGHVSFSVDMGSATLGSAEFDAELAKADWFNSKKLPQASFQSSAFTPAGPGKFKVAGTLTIKGHAQAVVVPVDVKVAGAQTIATGALTIKRLDFKIGEGDWSDTSAVADEVLVKFKLTFAKP